MYILYLDELNSLCRKLKEVLIANQVDLNNIFQYSIGTISDQLVSYDIITIDVKRSPSYNAIIDSFIFGMRFKRTRSDLEKHCVNFLKALKSVGGPVEDAAAMIQEEWSQSTQAIGIELALDYN